MSCFYNIGDLKILIDCIGAKCPKCQGDKIVPVIFGLIEKKDIGGVWDYYNDEKVIGILEEGGLIENPGCVPDSYMDENNNTPTKYCKSCKNYFDFRDVGF